MNYANYSENIYCSWSQNRYLVGVFCDVVLIAYHYLAGVFCDVVLITYHYLIAYHYFKSEK